MIALVRDPPDRIQGRFSGCMVHPFDDTPAPPGCATHNEDKRKSMKSQAVIGAGVCCSWIMQAALLSLQQAAGCTAAVQAMRQKEGSVSARPPMGRTLIGLQSASGAAGSRLRCWIRIRSLRPCRDARCEVPKTLMAARKPPPQTVKKNGCDQIRSAPVPPAVAVPQLFSSVSSISCVMSASTSSTEVLSCASTSSG